MPQQPYGAGHAPPPQGFPPPGTLGFVAGGRVSAQWPDGRHYLGTVAQIQGEMLYVHWLNGQQSWIASHLCTAQRPARAKNPGCGFGVAAIFVALAGLTQLAIRGQRVEHETLAAYAAVAVVLGLMGLIRRATRRS